MTLIQSRNNGYNDVKIKPYDALNKETGEVTNRALADYDTDTHKVILIREKENIPTKHKDYRMIDFNATYSLTYDEKALYYILTEYIGWEYNFVCDENGSKLSKSQFADSVGIGRPYNNKILKALEEKKRIKIVDNGNVKYIYLYSEYVWKGHDNNRKDTALYTYLDVINTNKGDLTTETNNDPSSYPTITMTVTEDYNENNGYKPFPGFDTDEVIEPIVETVKPVIEDVISHNTIPIIGDYDPYLEPKQNAVIRKYTKEENIQLWNKVNKLIEERQKQSNKERDYDKRKRTVITHKAIEWDIMEDEYNQYVYLLEHQEELK